MLDGTEHEQESIIREMADLLAELFEQVATTGQLDRQDLDLDDTTLVDLLDAASNGHVMVARLRELLAKHGWTGWTRVERRTI